MLFVFECLFFCRALPSSLLRVICSVFLKHDSLLVFCLSIDLCELLSGMCYLFDVDFLCSSHWLICCVLFVRFFLCSLFVVRRWLLVVGGWLPVVVLVCVVCCVLSLLYIVC